MNVHFVSIVNADRRCRTQTDNQLEFDQIGMISSWTDNDFDNYDLCVSLQNACRIPNIIFDCALMLAQTHIYKTKFPVWLLGCTSIAMKYFFDGFYVSDISNMLSLSHAMHTLDERVSDDVSILCSFRIDDGNFSHFRMKTMPNKEANNSYDIQKSHKGVSLILFHANYTRKHNVTREAAKTCLKLASMSLIEQRMLTLIGLFDMHTSDNLSYSHSMFVNCFQFRNACLYQCRQDRVYASSGISQHAKHIVVVDDDDFYCKFISNCFHDMKLDCKILESHKDIFQLSSFVQSDEKDEDSFSDNDTHIFL